MNEGARSAVADPPLEHVYDLGFDVATIPEDERERLGRHTLPLSPLTTATFILLSIVSLGILPTAWFARMHRCLPRITRRDLGGAKALLFSFVPILAFYGKFVVWLQLTDRVNLQYRLRGLPPPVERERIQRWLIFRLIPFVNWFAFFIMAPSVFARMIGAVDRLAHRRRHALMDTGARRLLEPGETVQLGLYGVSGLSTLVWAWLFGLLALLLVRRRARLVLLTERHVYVTQTTLNATESTRVVARYERGSVDVRLVGGPILGRGIAVGPHRIYFGSAGKPLREVARAIVDGAGRAGSEAPETGVGPAAV